MRTQAKRRNGGSCQLPGVRRSSAPTKLRDAAIHMRKMLSRFGRISPIYGINALQSPSIVSKLALLHVAHLDQLILSSKYPFHIISPRHLHHLLDWRYVYVCSPICLMATTWHRLFSMRTRRWSGEPCVADDVCILVARLRARGENTFILILYHSCC